MKAAKAPFLAWREVIDRGLCWLERLATGPGADNRTGDTLETSGDFDQFAVEVD